MKSKRFEALDARPVNQDGYVTEWPEVGLIAMNGPNDPTPSIRIEDGVVVELDGKQRADFDMIDTFIADSRELARQMMDFHVPRAEVVQLTTAMTPAKITEVVGTMSVLEMMMAVTKMRARLFPANQAHVTNLKDNPVQIAADAAEGALRGFAEEETTVGIVRYAPFNGSSRSRV